MSAQYVTKAHSKQIIKPDEVNFNEKVYYVIQEIRGNIIKLI